MEFSDLPYRYYEGTIRDYGWKQEELWISFPENGFPDGRAWHLGTYFMMKDEYLPPRAWVQSIRY